jgi:hypothetical protein
LKSYTFQIFYFITLPAGLQFNNNWQGKELQKSDSVHVRIVRETSAKAQAKTRLFEEGYL